jgi:hypothetical protein
MVAFGVGLLGHDEHLLWAELDAKAASFAPFIDDMHDAKGHLDALSIKRLSPIGHSLPSLLR